MKNKPILFVAFLALVIYMMAGCKKDDNSNDISTGGETIHVTVLNETGMPVNGATVSSGSSNAVTGGDGKATINNASLDGEKYKIKVEKDGYFPGYRNVMKIDGDGALYAKVKLIEQQVLGSVDANTAATLPGDKFKVELNGQGFSGLNGESVSGTITVHARYVRADNLELLAELMPGGDFSAIDQNGGEGILESYGFTAIEFRDESGNRVVPNTSSAEVVIDVPQEAMDRINTNGADFWAFNDESLEWGFGGGVSLNGNEVTMPVTASVFGNCDKMTSSATLEARFYCNTTDNPLKGKTVQLRGDLGYAMIYTTETNDNGEVLVQVGIPASGGTYQMTVEGCTMPVTFSADQTTDLGEVDACDDCSGGSANGNQVTINGTTVQINNPAGWELDTLSGPPDSVFLYLELSSDSGVTVGDFSYYWGFDLYLGNNPTITGSYQVTPNSLTSVGFVDFEQIVSPYHAPDSDCEGTGTVNITGYSNNIVSGNYNLNVPTSSCCPSCGVSTIQLNGTFELEPYQ
ncbi:MAG: carboxypeptidase-like regulatory domain-containing protein [Chitinophagales bacterium]